MKRWLLTILLFLLLGALVNVAVAWRCAVWVDDSLFGGEQGTSFTGDGYLSVVRSQVPGSTTVLVMNEDIPGMPVSAAGREPLDLVPRWSNSLLLPDGRSRLANARGWPLVSMWWSLQISRDAGDDGFFVASPGAIATQAAYPGDLGLYGLKAHLPLLPIWSNFAINTLFYAVLLWLPIRGPFALRRQIRKRRGRCLKCGYPAGASPTCTECGTALATRRRQA